MKFLSSLNELTDDDKVKPSNLIAHLMFTNLFTVKYLIYFVFSYSTGLIYEFKFKTITLFETLKS